MSVQFARSDIELTSVNGAGTDNAGAVALKPGINILTIDAGKLGGKLPSLMCSPVYLRIASLTASASTATIYPPTGGKINALAISAGFTIAKLKTMVCYPHANGLDYTVFKAA